MTFKFNHLFLIAFLSFSLLSGCKGDDRCGPGTSPLVDADSDCVADASDNCPFEYNGGQIDADDDGVGNVCDVDDNDETVATLLNDALLDLSKNFLTINDRLSAKYIEPANSSSAITYNPHSTTCSYFMIGCDNNFLGFINSETLGENSVANFENIFGDAKSKVSILNEYSFYGRSFTSCSAFNQDANYPPAIYCQTDSSTLFSGYLSLNPSIPHQIDTCQVLEGLNIYNKFCDE